MNLNLLRCYIVVAEELHFGRAARRLNILPSSLSRNINLLEQELGLRLLSRTTRDVALTQSGHSLALEAKSLLEHSSAVTDRVRSSATSKERVFRIGAMDSAATGLIPQLIHDFRELVPELELRLLEEKSAKLLPKLLSGALDVAIISQPTWPLAEIEFEFLLNQRIIVALPTNHPLAEYDVLRVDDLADVPLIVPSPRSRPHSHNLTIQLFQDASLQPRIVQQAEEKQTIINMVGAEIGAAIVPYWASRNVVQGVVFRPLVNNSGKPVEELPLAAAWVKGTHDVFRDKLMGLLKNNLERYSH
ncbi:MAG: LysR substrate-binding domain-containing protein [Gammaproteobacteria bacterium]|nr:LysR substrate-binding domain-containing protein [Gammaproteobacteria bacterium]MDE0513850.1 LysR substrate-binding domain-containing protein [Gammaproteobacteria bacterium]